MQPTINTNGNGSAKLIGTGPVGAGEYLIQPGDCIASIASEHGFFWQTLWNHPQNFELRRVRKDPNVLLPGDRVYIPPREAKSVPAATDTQHQFVLRGEPAHFTIQVCRADEPIACRPYLLNIDGSTSEGETDEEGNVTVPIRPNARYAKLRVSTEQEGWLVYDLEFGGIDPITEISGLQTRLINLGFACEKTGKLDDRTKAALTWFQKKSRLVVTGLPDEQTRQSLLNEHGS